MEGLTLVRLTCPCGKIAGRIRTVDHQLYLERDERWVFASALTSIPRSLKIVDPRFGTEGQGPLERLRSGRTVQGISWRCRCGRQVVVDGQRVAVALDHQRGDRATVADLIEVPHLL